MPKVMLIEDDVNMLSLLGTLLQLEGFDVVQLDHENTLDDILGTVRRTKPALALIDVYLRRLSGLDLLDGIRKDADLDSIRVLMSSGMDVRDECLQAGADDFVLKPYMPDELVNKIKHILGI